MEQSTQPAATSNAGQKGGRGRRGDDDPAVKFSKNLSYILRHGAVKERIPIRPDGFVKISDLMRHSKFKGKTLDDFHEAVNTNEKKRFLMEMDEGAQDETLASSWLIKANQGHSLEVEVQLEEITDPSEIPVVVHGTRKEILNLINAEGLKKMGRNHIHFAVGKFGEEGVISGMRKSCSAFIYVNAAKAMADGIKFYRSPNNVILSEGIDGVLRPEYFEKVETI
ncbi:tRNA 2'-phosphotransferase 1 [Blyttiomyces sp. JEL0837]|nr:tRNA 2'-phosphotransferase 1 [Blyttiomyces sp. JEL0837]